MNIKNEIIKIGLSDGHWFAGQLNKHPKIYKNLGIKGLESLIHVVKMSPEWFAQREYTTIWHDFAEIISERLGIGYGQAQNNVKLYKESFYKGFLSRINLNY